MNERNRYACLSARLHSIVSRCYYKSCPRYKDYGGRGIRVDPRWYDEKTGRHHVKEFAEWAYENGCAEGLQIDRIDNDGPYSPDNCRFVTAHDNNRNRRSTVRIEIGGVTMCAKDWCAVFGMSYQLFNMRKDRGWNPYLAVVVPKGMRRPHACIHKGGKTGRCHRHGNRSKKGTPCAFANEDEMRGCPHFKEADPMENPGYRRFAGEHGRCRLEE